MSNTLIFFLLASAVFILVVGLAFAGGLKLRERDAFAGLSLRAAKWVGLYTAFLMVLALAAFFLPREKLLPVLTPGQGETYQRITQEVRETVYGEAPVSPEQLKQLQGLCLLSQEELPFFGEELFLKPCSQQVTFVLVEEQPQRTGSLGYSMYSTPLVASPFDEQVWVDLSQYIETIPLTLEGDTLQVQSVERFSNTDRERLRMFAPWKGMGALQEKTSYVDGGISVLLLEVPQGVKVTLLPYGEEEPLAFLTAHQG